MHQSAFTHWLYSSGKILTFFSTIVHSLISKVFRLYNLHNPTILSLGLFFYYLNFRTKTLFSILPPPIINKCLAHSNLLFPNSLGFLSQRYRVHIDSDFSIFFLNWPICLHQYLLDLNLLDNNYNHSTHIIIIFKQYIRDKINVLEVVENVWHPLMIFMLIKFAQMQERATQKKVYFVYCFRIIISSFVISIL